MSRKPDDNLPLSRPERRVSDDEAALWEQITRNVEPHTGVRTRVDPAVPTDADHLLKNQMHELSAHAAIPYDRYPPIDTPASVQSLKYARDKAKPAQPPGEIQRRDLRRLARGSETIDARLDLHGMRQVEAHGALSCFLVSCQASGKRHVLVITGKGRERPQSEEFRLFDNYERGVLKQMVPQWLHEPHLQGLVVSCSGAAPNHGGDGALYIRLKRA